LNDVLSLDATDQLQALAARRISARELLEASVEQTDRLNPKLNAVVSRDLDRAYASARLIDDRRARRESLGLLAGLPMTVKDALDVEGLPASVGMESLLHRAATDAVVVSRVRAEGAIVWGKTNTPVKAADWQTYNALYGTTNPIVHMVPRVSGAASSLRKLFAATLAESVCRSTCSRCERIKRPKSVNRI
jgi:amidase